MKKLQKILRASIVPLMLLGLVSCEVGPNYSTPELATPGKFGEAPEVDDAQKANLQCWWKSFNDPVLEQLISEALDSNLDLQLAAERVVEARKLLRITYSELTPSLNTHGSYTRSRNSRNGTPAASGSAATTDLTGDDSIKDEPLEVGVPADTTTTSSSVSARPKDLYEAGFDASWELDVFGGARREVEAAMYNADAAVEARRNALVTLLAEVAQNYILLRGVQHEWAITTENIQAEQETLNIQKIRLEAGIANDLTVAQAEAQLNNTQSQLPTLEVQQAQAIHRLSILLGLEPSALEQRLIVQAPIPVGPAIVPPGLPSDLVRRRPDVRAAERKVAQANALIGAAMSDLFPKVTLNGKYGWRSEAFSKLDNSDSAFWSFGPSITLPIFDLWAIWVNVELHESRERQALIVYKQTVLNAFEEVENSLISLSKEQTRHDALQRSVQSNRRAFDLARQLNDAGVVDFLNVLQAQLALFVAEDALARSDQAVSTNLVALYKALGGGWEQLDQEG